MPELTSPNFTEDRCGSGSILAIVLHEVDTPLETLDALHLQCLDEQMGGHESFHFGISGCTVRNYIDIANTAWSFPPDAETDELYEDFPPVVAEPDVNPNCLTVNIAVVTGARSTAVGCKPGEFSSFQIKCLGNLLCELVQETGLPLDDTAILVAPKELPGLDLTAVLECAQVCLDEATAEPDIPPGADALCDLIAELPTAPATTDPVQVVGADCMLYTLPTDMSAPPIMAQDCAGAAIDFSVLVSLATCADLATIGDQVVTNTTNIATNATNITNNTTNITTNTTDITEIQNMLANLQACDGTALDLTNPVQLAECADVPNLCDPAAVVAYNPDQPLRFAQGDCTVVEVAPSTTCSPATVNSALGIGAAGLGFYKVRENLPIRLISANGALIPSTDGVVIIDASAADLGFVLTTPGECDVNHFWIKRSDAVVGNNVLISPEAGTIDGCANISLGTPGPFCPNRGEAVHVAWTGAEWVII